ncbi:MAG TPA: hypothetical protein VL404_08450 [Candidatus Eisenbacteria bacterium]|nr:hypothetical protein [Candidatus Eisenbacteria bacterium]
MRHKDAALTVFLTTLFSLSLAGGALANVEQAKLYKSVFGGEKPKCLTCHVDKLPKKEDGKHDPNDYGKKLTAVNPKPDEATYKQVGANPDAVY